MPPTVTVIIPTYNSAALVTQAIDSALAQTTAPTEIIVIDDGSADDTKTRLAPYTNRIKYHHQSNQGVAAARNLGLREATSDFIAFLDADDLWHPQKLELQLQAIATHSEISLLATERSATISTLPLQNPNDQIQKIPWKDLVVKNRFTTSSVLLRRSILNQTGHFDTALQGPEDYDLWLRIAELAPVAKLHLPLTHYRDLPNSLSHQSQTMHAGMLRILSKLDDRNAWQGRWLLRRKAYGYCNYSCAYMASAANLPAQALSQITRSILAYPFPYRKTEIRFSLARLRIWTIQLTKLLRFARTRAPQAGATSMNQSISVPDQRSSANRALRRFARRALTFHIPTGSLLKPLFKSLYRTHLILRESAIWATRFFWYEPLFRSQCRSIGTAFRMEALPYLSGRGDITIGDRVRLSGKSTIGFSNRPTANPELQIGDETFIAHNCRFHIASSIRIGQHCLISNSVSIRDYDGHPTDAARRRAGESTPPEGIDSVIIEDDVWIGANAIILKGVTIGSRSIIASGAVVHRDVPPDCVVAGNPAQIVKWLAPNAATQRVEAA